jgi:biotin carboxylase
VPNALKALVPLRHQLRGGLVFSDKAVQSGAQLLERLNLQVDNATLAAGAFSKICYRQIEAEHQSILEPQGLFIPAHAIIYNAEELLNFVQRYPDGVVLKPACEGNNRGVVFLDSTANLHQALQEIEPYLSHGIICEQVIPFQQEYSFDGLAHLFFLTEKCSASGRYPVETGQILPARANYNQRLLLSKIGKIANILVGQCHGPFHNEIKISSDGSAAAVVEPNRRPAGMKIWSLAERVYGLNFYHIWVDQVLGKPLPKELPAPQGIAATIMLRASHDGYIDLPVEAENEPERLFNKAVALLQQTGVTHELEWFDFILLPRQSNRVRAIPKDNADFLAQVCVYSPNLDMDIVAIKTAISNCWQQVLTPYIYQEQPKMALTV